MPVFASAISARSPTVVTRMSHPSNLLGAYIHDLAHCPMLNVDQQRRLASVLRDSSQSQCERDAAKRALLESNLRFAFALAKQHQGRGVELAEDRKSTRLNSSHPSISYAVFCLKKKKK